MLLKLGVGVISGSVAIISDGIHSATDLLAALAAWLSVRVSAKPADSCHPWGHGKYENLAALGQGILVLASAGVIAWHSLGRLINPIPLTVIGWGMFVTAVSIVMHSAVTWRMWKVARETESPALAGGALHMLTDISSSLAVLIGLGFARFGGILIADAIAALAVTVMIVTGAVKLIVSSSRDLVDSSLPNREQGAIEDILAGHMPPLKGFHKLRARRVGRFRYLEAHLVVDGALSVEQAHDLCDHLEEHLQEQIPNSRSLLHIEPEVIDC
jgi:cation diffusion facilitator family transporter